MVKYQKEINNRIVELSIIKSNLNKRLKEYPNYKKFGFKEVV